MDGLDPSSGLTLRVCMALALASVVQSGDWMPHSKVSSKGASCPFYQSACSHKSKLGRPHACKASMNYISESQMVGHGSQGVHEQLHMGLMNFLL